MKAEIWNWNNWYNLWNGSHIPILYSNDKLYEDITERFRKQLNTAGFNIIGELKYKFYPYGYTCLFLLSESHLATFDEENRYYIELSSCNKEFYDKFLDIQK